MSEMLHLQLILVQYIQTVMYSKLTSRKFFASPESVNQEPKITAYIQLLPFTSGGDELSWASICRSA